MTVKRWYRSTQALLVFTAIAGAVAMALHSKPGAFVAAGFYVLMTVSFIRTCSRQRREIERIMKER